MFGITDETVGMTSDVDRECQIGVCRVKTFQSMQLMLLANETMGSLGAGDEIGFDVDLHGTFGEIATNNGRKEPVVWGCVGGGCCCCGGGDRHEQSGQQTAVLCKHSLCTVGLFN